MKNKLDTDTAELSFEEVERGCRCRIIYRSNVVASGIGHNRVDALLDAWINVRGKAEEIRRYLTRANSDTQFNEFFKIL